MLTRHHDPSPADERGATMVIMALFLTVMLGLSALVVDLGAARHEKRKAQNLSDSASLAAVQELGDTALAADVRMDNAAAQVLTYVQRRQPTPPAGFDTWNAAWAACTDPQRLEVASTSSECISFAGPDADTSATTTPVKIRVRMPATSADTYFVRAVGAESIPVDAAATAAIGSPMLFQGRLVLPFAHGPDTDSAWKRRPWRWWRSSRVPGLTLIYDDNNLSTWDKSCRQVSGDPPSKAACVFKSPRLSTFTAEGATSEQNALRVNLAMGLDHQLKTYPPNSPPGGPPTRVCDGALSAGTSPCTATNVGTSNVANHVVTAQGRRWSWTCFLFSCSWESQDTGTWNSWRDAVDAGLALGTNSSEYFTVGGTNFCARLARPALTDTNYDQPRPGGTCTPDGPTVDLTWDCGLFCTATRRINGRHIARYMSQEAFDHFWGNPGGSNSGCRGDPADPDRSVDNVHHGDWTKDGGWFNSAVSGATRLGWYLTQSDDNPYPCNGPPAAPIFTADITRDPRFAWITIVQSDCNDAGWAWGWWDWSWGTHGSTWGWQRDETRCAITTPKYVVEFRAVYMDRIELNGSRIDKVYAWEFDPALIEPWTAVGPVPADTPLEYFQGGPMTPTLEN